MFAHSDGIFSTTFHFSLPFPIFVGFFFFFATLKTCQRIARAIVWKIWLPFDAVWSVRKIPHRSGVDSLSLARWFIRTFAKWDEIYFAFDFAREAGDRFTETRFDFSIISFSLSRWRWTDAGRLFGSRQNKLDIFSRDGWRTVVSRDFASLNFGFGRVSGAKNGCWRFHEERWKWLKICKKKFFWEKSRSSERRKRIFKLRGKLIFSFETHLKS